jgi:predicted nucleic acid-binding protein
MFKAIGQSITSFTNVIVKACAVLEKSVGLIENEVDNLSAEQEMRMDIIITERLERKAAREKAEKSVQRTNKKRKSSTTQPQA